MSMKVRQVSLTKRQDDYIEAQRAKTGISISDQIRRILDDYFEIKGIK